MIALCYDFSCSLLTKRQIIMVHPWLGLTRKQQGGLGWLLIDISLSFLFSNGKVADRH